MTITWPGDVPRLDPARPAGFPDDVQRFRLVCTLMDVYRLSMNPVRLYLAMRAFASPDGALFASKRDLASASGLLSSVIPSVVHRLLDAGLITSEPWFEDDTCEHGGSRHRAGTRYVVLPLSSAPPPPSIARPPSSSLPF